MTIQHATFPQNLTQVTQSDNDDPIELLTVKITVIFCNIFSPTQLASIYKTWNFDITTSLLPNLNSSVEIKNLFDSCMNEALNNPAENPMILAMGMTFAIQHFLRTTNLEKGLKIPLKVGAYQYADFTLSAQGLYTLQLVKKNDPSPTITFTLDSVEKERKMAEANLYKRLAML